MDKKPTIQTILDNAQKNMTNAIGAVDYPSLCGIYEGMLLSIESLGIDTFKTLISKVQNLTKT